MARSKFLFATLLAFAITLSGPSKAQAPAQQLPSTLQPTAPATPAQPSPAAAAAQTPQPDADEVGNVASVKGAATVTRKGASQPLKIKDPIFKGDLLRTGANATLGIIFDDETTFNLSANASIEVNEFVYAADSQNNSALFNIARGTVAFAANQVAKTGDMKITTPSTVLGIRGTSGVIEVPDGPMPGVLPEVSVKLYQDEDGRVGRIEMFRAIGGPQIGLLTRPATGVALRIGAGGLFSAVPLVIPAAQITRDRAFVRSTFVARNSGRQMIIQRRDLRTPGLQRPNNQRPQNLRQQNQQRNLRQQGPQRGNLSPGQRTNRPQNATRPQNQPGARATGPQQQNSQRQNLQRQNLQRQNLQRQNLQRANTPRTQRAQPTQPARRRPQR